MIQLIGLDFGTTTSSAVVASANLMRNFVTGRSEITDVRETYRSDMVFTPVVNDRLNEGQLASLLDNWLNEGCVRPQDIFGGGALLTGLTARKENSVAVIRQVRSRVGNALIASANDPCLESWLAFMGSCAALSRSHPDTWFINLDIGGGTTNLALGKNGVVYATGCLFVGARHIQIESDAARQPVEAWTEVHATNGLSSPSECGLQSTQMEPTRIVKLSAWGRLVLDHLLIHKSPGDILQKSEIALIVAFYVNLLHAAVAGDVGVLQEPTARAHEQVAFRPVIADFDWRDAVVTLSGGVGELVYAHERGQPWPALTKYGDLGVALAEGLWSDAAWGGHLQSFRPQGGGRATSFGLLRHITQVSGSTVHLSPTTVLPLDDLPILGTISAASSQSQLRELSDLAMRSDGGACLRVELPEPDAASVRALAQRITDALQECRFPAQHPLVLLVAENIGKVLGHYVTRWGTLPLNLVVIDEIALRDAQYARIGALRDHVIPVSFYGLQS